MQHPKKIFGFCLSLILASHAQATEEIPTPSQKMRPIYVEPSKTEETTPAGFIEHLELLRAEDPVYPNSALTTNETKNTTLKLLVNNRGEVVQSEIAKSSGSEELDAAALKAITKTTFLPYIDKSTGQATHVYTSYVYSFKPHAMAAESKTDQPKQKHGGRKKAAAQ